MGRSAPRNIVGDLGNGVMKLAQTQEERERLMLAIYQPMQRAVYPNLIANGLLSFSGKVLRCLRCGGYITIGDNRKCECGKKEHKVTWVPDESGIMFVWDEKRL